MNILLKSAGVGLICISFAGCKVNKTQEGKLPSVNVTTNSGQMPAYNVEGPKVDVGSKNETVKVPTVRVSTPGHH